MFFQNMLPLLALCKALNITISLDGNLVCLVTNPIANANSPDGLRVPQMIKGTAQELDESLHEFFASMSLGVKSIQDQLAENESIMQEEKKRIAANVKPKGKSTGQSTGKSEPASGSNDDDDDDEGSKDMTPASSSSEPESATSKTTNATVTAPLIPNDLFGDD